MFEAPGSPRFARDDGSGSYLSVRPKGCARHFDAYGAVARSQGLVIPTGD